MVKKIKHESMSKAIKLTEEVYNMLGVLGGKKETYCDIVKRVVEHYRSCPSKN